MPDQNARDSHLVDVDLKQPGTAALYAWLWPGAGHIYQGRYGKGILFMVCILTTYFFGLAISDGHAVYASLHEHDRRWQYVCQVGVGVPALPALVQNYVVRHQPDNGFGDDDEVPGLSILNGWYAPPRNPQHPSAADELAGWHREAPVYFEIGTLYTMVAGLLNLLAAYDAYAGPFIPDPEDDEEDDPANDEGGKSKR